MATSVSPSSNFCRISVFINYMIGFYLIISLALSLLIFSTLREVAESGILGEVDRSEIFLELILLPPLTVIDFLNFLGEDPDAYTCTGGVIYFKTFSCFVLDMQYESNSGGMKS